MARVMFNSFAVISLSDNKLTMFQEAFKTPLTVNTRPLLRVEYPRIKPPTQKSYLSY